MTRKIKLLILNIKIWIAEKKLKRKIKKLDEYYSGKKFRSYTDI